MTKRITTKETDAAWAKLAKAGLTPRQQQAIRNSVLWDAIREAERKCQYNGEIKARTLMSHWSLEAQHHDPQRAINNAVFWHHAKLNHYWTHDPATGRNTICTEQF